MLLITFTCSCSCELKVTSSRGGIWFFPVNLSASGTDPDDEIVLRAQGLNKETKVYFRLTSMTE